MCAMLALVAPEELQISQLRATRFLDSYIGGCVSIAAQDAKRFMGTC